MGYPRLAKSHVLSWPNSGIGHAVENDAQPCAQPDGPVYGFVGQHRRGPPVSLNVGRQDGATFDPQQLPG